MYIIMIRREGTDSNLDFVIGTSTTVRLTPTTMLTTTTTCTTSQIG
jgi:hypothetical protein